MTQQGRILAEDSLDRWHGLRQLDTVESHTSSWDYRSLSTRPQSATSAIDNDNGHGPQPPTVAWRDPGTTFTLADHPEHDLDAEEQRRFLITGITHQARNALQEVPLGCNLTESLGDGSPENATDNGKKSPKTKSDPDPVDHYRNRITAIRASIPWRPLINDAHGRHITLVRTKFGDENQGASK